jgi:hypothetical protein
MGRPWAGQAGAKDCERRVKEGRTKPEVIRILKRYVAREVYRHLPRG